MPLNLRRRFADVSRCGDADATESPKAIRFFHPGYGKAPITNDAQPPIRDALISFPAFDDGGIFYDIAHTACGILAGNRWDGYFSFDRQGETVVERPIDGILRERAYFFCLPQPRNSSVDPYPIFARFGDWRFPHNDLPPCWERLRPRFHGDANGIIRRCALTDCGLSVDAAHLIPVKETSWYNDNGMMDYGKATSFSTEAVNSLTNVISLRTDVHRMFDERNFCFAPKADEYQREVLPLRTREDDGIASTNISVNEVQLPSTDQHDSGKASRTEPSSSDTSPAPVVLAAHIRMDHFLPNIFRDFLFMTKEPRVLLVWDEELGQYRTERAEKSKCIMTAQEARARSKSPTKRQRPTGETGQVDQEYLYGEDEFDESDHVRDQYADDSSAIDSGFHDEVFDNDTYDSPERGRSRKRKFSEPCWQDGGDDATEVKRTNRSVLWH
ncbi:HNH nuclease [Fusarium oxysporum f. sp. vasinfectum]|nr:HNH nuclease [Fusarium oxysporum f. sp. vasinfectum]